MKTSLITGLLLSLLVILQGQLWLGRGSIPNVQQLQQEIESKTLSNVQAALANDRLAAEISDLQEGLEMVEERARIELGMVRNNEIFVQIAK